MGAVDKSGWVLGAVLARQGAALRDKPYVQFQDDPPLTFGDMDNRANRVANALAAMGVQRDERVLLMMPNSVEFLDSWFGVSRLGAVMVPVNTAYKGGFLEHVINNAAVNGSARVMIIDREYVPLLQASEDRVPQLETVVVRNAKGSKTDLPSFSRLRAVSFDSLFDAPDTTVQVPVAYHDIGAIMYTSGTTGPSKGVLMPHAHLYLYGHAKIKAIRLTADDIYYCCMPLFHANALLMQVYSALIVGCRLVLARSFSASRWLDDVRRHGATVTNTLGVMTEFIYRQPPRAEDRDHHLRVIVAVPIAPEWGEAFQQRFNTRLLEGYGMTEVNIPTYMPYEDNLRDHSCGKVLDEWFEMAIVDPETDEELPPNTVGEMVVRPREPWVFMAGYHAMPEKTVEAWRNFWFHTGDAGTRDEEGYFYFVDRMKDCIRRRGENISSYEIEQVLNDHPAVAESAAVAVKSSIAGGEDEVKACVLLRPEMRLQPGELLDYCQERMPYFAVPRYVEFVSDMPKTPTEKLRKHILREAGITAATWDREAAGYVVRR
ncbi:MAG: AMP-binding protein [Candidatus Tectomicrobia bacterium]|nr:AMP-binding protein [Candidatus Tectomicrobia bacterium]